jgi:hypothetical protein
MHSQSTTVPADSFTGHASLAPLGAKLRAIDLFDPIRQHVAMPQKHVLDAPADKRFDALIAVLAGAHGLCEINTRLRCDPVLQRAFGRERRAEQSVVQDTLDAATTDTFRQMLYACDAIFARHGRAVRQPEIAWLLERG